MNKYSGLDNLNDGYVFKDVIRDTLQTTTFYAVSPSGESCIVKVLNTGQLKPSDLALFRKEYESLISLGIKGVLKVSEVGLYRDKPAVVSEYFEPFFLSDYMRGGRIDTGEFLRIAIRITEVLTDVHKNSLLCLDIRPGNIAYEPDSINIIDLSSTVILTRKHEQLFNHEFINESLPYISPEQTGRMNRSVDYRSDLYSLGIVLYEMLTGRLPFLSDDPMEVLHFHIAKNAQPPSEIDRGIPSVLSDIIMKLIEKTPEERYQNTSGLLADLVRCSNQYTSTGRIDPFKIGTEDISPFLTIPDILVGREREIDVLRSVFYRTGSHLPGAHDRGRGVSLVLLYGNAGCGKSSLANDLRKLVSANKGYFISGKHHEHQQNVPYGAIVEAFSGMVRQVIAESEERIARLAGIIREALGDNARVMTDIIPDLELLIGSQPAAPELGSDGSQNRLNYIFSRFVKAMASAAQSVVLFIDDIQWMDAASIKLVKGLIGNREIDNLMLVLSCRTEGFSNSAHSDSLIDFDEPGIEATRIQLYPLSPDDTITYVHRFAALNDDDARLLGSLVYQKTGGNPFYINQLMKTLYGNGALYYTPGQGWCLNSNVINNTTIADNVIALVSERIDAMPPEKKKILCTCACLGSRFDIETAAEIENDTVMNVYSAVMFGIDQGILVKQDKEYSFAHDSIQEAVYSLINEDGKAIIHMKAGKALMAKLQGDEHEEHIDHVVNQFTAALPAVKTEDEKLTIARLFLSASRKAISSAAYESSLVYIKNALKLAGQEYWERDYELALSLHRAAAESAFLAADFRYMDKIISLSLKKIRSFMDRILIHELVIQAHYARNRMTEGLNEGLRVLHLLKEPLPEKPKKFHVIRGLISTKLLLRKRGIDELLGMKDMANPVKSAAFDIINNMGISAYKSSPRMLPLIVFRAVEFSVRYGCAPATAYSFAGYGMILCGALGEIDKGFEYGSLALKLSERPGGVKYRARTIHLVYCMIWHWKNHLRDTLDNILYAYKLGMETGDIEDATSSAHLYCLYKYLCGFSLDDLASEMEYYEGIIKRFRQETNLNYLRIERQAAINLIQQSDDPCILEGEAYSEKLMLPVHETAGDRTAIAILNFQKMILNFLFGNYSGALDCAGRAEANLDSLIGLGFIPVFYFYDSLTRLAAYNGSATGERKKILKRVSAGLKKITGWSKYAPVNHEHKRMLIEAELCRVTGRFNEAMALYDSAVKGARDNGYVQEAAIASECAARFFMSTGQEKVASVYALEAAELYEQWGSTVKAAQVREVYDSFLARSASAGKAGASAISDRNGSGALSGLWNPALDTAALVSAMHSISGEIVLDRFIENLMRLIIENAGAQRGVLIVSRNDELMVAAEGLADIAPSVIKKPLKLSEYSGIPLSIINYIRRTGETVALANASSDRLFMFDDYIQSNKIRSVMCLPMVHQQKMRGILYLENNLATDVFRPDRMEIVSLLSVQAAISLENAVFFERALAAESEIQGQFEEMQSQYEEMEAMNEELQRAYNDLDLAHSRLAEEGRMLSIFRQMADSSVQGMSITTLDGRIIYINSAFCKIGGFSEDQVMAGMNILDLLSDSMRERVEKHIMPVVLEKGQWIDELKLLNRLNEKKQAIQTMFLLREANGEPLFLANIITDITGIREAESIMRESEERYRLLVETMNDGLCILDRKGHFTYVNKSLCAMLGYMADELLGRHITSVLDDENRKSFMYEYSRRENGENSIYEIEWTRKDSGRLSTIVSPKSIYDSDGRFIASFGVITNITERKNAEREKDRIQAQLLHSQKMEAIGTLAGGIAHDFNNMLTSIFGNTDLLLLDMDINDRKYSLVQEIANAAEKSASLTRQLLTFSRKQIMETSLVNLNSVILEMEKMLNRLIGEDIKLTVELAPETGNINADKSQLEQIILNLIVNARDAMPDGGKLLIRTESVFFESTPEGGPENISGSFARLSIEDNGTGMDAELVGKIFEPFFTTKETNKGTGLGLAVVYGIVNQHDGWIEVDSEPGKGTIFRIYMPVLSGQYVKPSPEYINIQNASNKKGFGEKILLVEDQEDVSKFIRSALTGFGYHVTQAFDIQSAISLFEQENGDFDLLLSDIVLPDGKGINLADMLLERNPEMKIILSSGYTEQKFQFRIIREKHYNFLPKPYTLDSLLEMVRRVIDFKDE